MIKSLNHHSMTDSGRSMVEMLGVLAIIAVLTVGGIAGYSYGMDRLNASIIIDGLEERVVVAKSQLVQGQEINFREFQGDNEQDTINGVYPVELIAKTKYAGEYNMKVSGMRESVCNAIMDSGWKTPVESFPDCENATPSITFVFAGTTDSSDTGSRACSEGLYGKNCDVDCSKAHMSGYDGKNCTCDTGYYGSDCGVYCSPSEHKTYDGSSGCKCMTGWQEPACTSCDTYYEKDSEGSCTFRCTYSSAHASESCCTQLGGEIGNTGKYCCDPNNKGFDISGNTWDPEECGCPDGYPNISTGNREYCCDNGIASYWKGQVYDNDPAGCCPFTPLEVSGGSYVCCDQYGDEYNSLGEYVGNRQDCCETAAVGGKYMDGVCCEKDGSGYLTGKEIRGYEESRCMDSECQMNTEYCCQNYYGGPGHGLWYNNHCCSFYSDSEPDGHLIDGTEDTSNCCPSINETISTDFCCEAYYGKMNGGTCCGRDADHNPNGRTIDGDLDTDNCCNSDSIKTNQECCEGTGPNVWMTDSSVCCVEGSDGYHTGYRADGTADRQNCCPGGLETSKYCCEGNPADHAWIEDKRLCCYLENDNEGCCQGMTGNNDAYLLDGYCCSDEGKDGYGNNDSNCCKKTGEQSENAICCNEQYSGYTWASTYTTCCYRDNDSNNCCKYFKGASASLTGDACCEDDSCGGPEATRNKCTCTTS